MAKKTNPCYRCGGGQILPQFKHVDAGVCFRCRGSGIDPGRDPSRRYTPRSTSGASKSPPPTGATAREMAVEAMNSVAYRFKYIEGGGWQEEGFDGPEEAYSLLGYRLAMAVFDLSVFNRAVARARARIPFDYRLAFESGLAGGIRELRDQFHGIVWEDG